MLNGTYMKLLILPAHSMETARPYMGNGYDLWEVSTTNQFRQGWDARIMLWIYSLALCSWLWL